MKVHVQSVWRAAASRCATGCLAFALHAALLGPTQPAVAALFTPPDWVTTDNGVELKRQSDENSKLTDKQAKKVFDSGLDFASRGADEESQTRNDDALKKAEDRFSLLIDELAPNFYGAYTNRANVRVARGNYADAVADYDAALRLAPLSDDVWVTLLNRGSTLGALGRNDEALADMQRSVTLSKSDRLALLGRAGAYHALGNWEGAQADFGAVIEKNPTDVQPFWLRHSLDLFESGRRAEGLGIARRLVAKFDIEPESNLAVDSLLWADGSANDREEALRRWKLAPVETRSRMVKIDPAERAWPPTATKAADEFRAAAAASTAAATEQPAPAADAAAASS